MICISGQPQRYQTEGCIRGPKDNKNVHVLLADLKECIRTSNHERGKLLHAEAIECGHESDIYVATTLINMYSKCGSVGLACQVFNSIELPNVVSWNSLMLGYTDNGKALSALGLFTRMKCSGPAPNSVTFVAALKACTTLGLGDTCVSDWGKGIHNLAVGTGCHLDSYVQNTLIDMYAKSCSMKEARQVFDSMEQPNLVSWTALILGYAEDEKALTALDLFTRMKCEGLAPNSVTLLAVLKACISLALTEASSADCWVRGKEVHDLAVKHGCDSDIKLQNSLVDMYAKCGSMVDALQIFHSMKHHNVVSWTALILGYVENGQGVAALDLFITMKSRGPAPDSVTFSTALRVCAMLGALELGRTLHSEIESGNHLNEIVVNCLVDFYAKCGSLMEAQNVFDSHVKTRNLITWTTLLEGFSSCGDHETVFRLFKEMQDAGFQPNSVTFLSILTCCSHAGLVEKGIECFDEMTSKFGIIPTIEHYNCMIDIFGRAKKLDDAMALIRCGSCSSNYVTWMTILGACFRWKLVEVGKLAFQSLIMFKEGNAAAYVLMGQIYGSRGMLQEQEMMMAMRQKLDPAQ